MTQTDASISAAKDAFSDGRYEDCLHQLDAVHDRVGRSPSSVKLAHDALMKMGELHRALAELNALRALRPDHDTDVAARRVLGRIIETDRQWLPTIDGGASPRPVEAEGERILHLLKESLPYSETGFTMRSRMTLRAQALAGFVPEVITSLGFPGSRGIPEFPAIEKVDDVRHHRLPFASRNPLDLPADVYVTLGARAAAPLAAAFGPHVIQAGTGYRGYETALIGIALADRLTVPLVYEVRGFQEATWTSNVERSERGEYYHRRFDQEIRCMRRADAVITIAEAMANEIVDRGISAEKVSVVPNAVDVNRFTPRAKRADLVEKYGLGDRFVVGYISNLGAREGIDYLLNAVAILRARGLDICALVAGQGPERSHLDTLVSDLHLEPHVVLPGHIPNQDIEDHYALIDLFVVPRVDDRAARWVTPLKPLEAMSMAVPVIASDLPALCELVEPGVRGEVFPPSDAPALADTIAGLVQDAPRRHEYARTANEWVRENRTLESNGVRYAQILRPLL